MIKIEKNRLSPDYTAEDLKNATAARLGIGPAHILWAREARRAPEYGAGKPCWDVDILAAADLDEEALLAGCRDKLIGRELRMTYRAPRRGTWAHRPIVAGCGPAGIFAALVLALAGARPIVLERGLDVDARAQAVRRFALTGALDPECNMQFGEGGAGAFSDGKLKTGLMDFRKKFILSEFVAAGAPREIIFDSRRHIGTDRLPGAVRGLRRRLTELGGEVRFGVRVSDILTSGGRVCGVGAVAGGEYSEIYSDAVVLAVGHSARDTFSALAARRVPLAPRPAAIGVRVEHPQELIDRLVYGDAAVHAALGAADYHMVAHIGGGRTVYTFCMCPGGCVVPTASEPGGIVTNGMSPYARDGENANSALLVCLPAGECGGGLFGSVKYQREAEQAAFRAGGGDFRAPVQLLGDFLDGRGSSSFADVAPTYRPGTSFAPVDSYLPPQVCEALRQGIRAMDEWMPGFACRGAVLTGAETRSSSPVRILRDENFESPLRGLYPCGEGAGYAGGIVSSALDGMLCAEAVIKSGAQR
jgi:uncharacterized FAD-dependent dehydrogenase